MQRNIKESGFTLVELLVSVAIIGLLAAIAVPQFNEIRARAYNAQAVGFGSSLKFALESYVADEWDKEYHNIIFWRHRADGTNEFGNGGEGFQRFVGEPPKEMFFYLSLNTRPINASSSGLSWESYTNIGHCRSTTSNDSQAIYNYWTFYPIKVKAGEKQRTGSYKIDKLARGCS